MDEPGYRPVDVPQAAPVGLPHHQLHRLGVALPVLLHLGEQLDPGGQGVLIHPQAGVALLSLGGLLLPALQPQGVAGDHVLDAVPLLPGLFQLLVRLPQVGAGKLQPLLQASQLLAHRLVPVQHLLGGGGQGGEKGLGLVGVGGLGGLLPPQGLQLLGQGTGRA